MDRITSRSDTDGVRVVALTGPAPSIPFSPVEANGAPVDYVPAYLRHLLGGTETGWLAEFRSSHILFAQFPDFSFSGPNDLPLL